MQLSKRLHLGSNRHLSLPALAGGGTVKLTQAILLCGKTLYDLSGGGHGTGSQATAAKGKKGERWKIIITFFYLPSRMTG